MQVPDAWPNTFRQSRFLSAVDFVQADRMRRMVALEMSRVFDQVDLLMVPALRDEVVARVERRPGVQRPQGVVQPVEVELVEGLEALLPAVSKRLRRSGATPATSVAAPRKSIWC